MLGKKLRFLEYLHEIRDREENMALGPTYDAYGPVDSEPRSPLAR